MGWLGWIGVAAAVALVAYLAQMIYLSVVLKWEDDRTRGLNYYGLTPEGRAAFKRALRRHARLLHPILALSGRLSKFSFQRASFRHGDIAAPRGSCTPESFARGVEYRPRPEDVFVVTQMKCGTTWMQHLVHEVLSRGRGEIVASGRTLYAICPWLEGVRSVPLDQAPLVGAERPSRIVKTHLPAGLCPRDAAARYLYVARHPVACFASCADFIAASAGPLAPPLSVVEEWFCSRESMWWGSWPDHVRGWWDRAAGESNVLFLYFEEMKADLPGVARRVAEFLGLAPLTAAELAAVVEKCGFAYMRQHQEAFEMVPPSILQTDAELFVRGSADRHRDVPEEVRRRVGAWCARELAGSGFPLASRYPDLVT